HWIHNSFKVYLTIDPNIAARRIHEDIMQGRRRAEEAVTILETTTSIEDQNESARERYFRTYGIDITNTSPFDLVINTDKITAAEVAALIRQHYREYQQK
ncbi:MAG: hypothetical protein KJN72_13430, partial [Woeseia sp.]|nr:hypothetical protein [Woeseia sp.]